MQKSSQLLRRDSVQDLFADYYYDETFSALSSQYFSHMTSSSRNTAGGTTTVAAK
jgi:hypothetical protein